MMAGSKDEDNMVEEATALHQMINSETKQLRLFDSEHHLPAEYIQVGAEWIKRYFESYALRRLGDRLRHRRITSSSVLSSREWNKGEI
jgi:hypothetical protein